MGDRGGRKGFFWELGKVWSGARCGEGWVRMGSPVRVQGEVARVRHLGGS